MSQQTAYPIYSDNVTVTSPVALASGTVKRSTLALTSCVGAYLTAYVAKGGATQPSAAIGVRIRRLDNNGTAGTVGGQGINGLASFTASRTGTIYSTVIKKDMAAGVSTVSVSHVNNFTVGDLVMLTDATYTRLEIHRIVRKISANPSQLVFDQPTTFAHTSAQADKVRSLAEAFGPTWLPGGATYEVIFDYGAATAGSAQVVWAKAHKYVYDRAKY